LGPIYRCWTNGLRRGERHLCVTIEQYRALLKETGDKPSAGFPAIPLSGKNFTLPAVAGIVPPAYQPSDRYGRIANEPGSARRLFANLPCRQGKIEV
jgi:hypothetical protein